MAYAQLHRGKQQRTDQSMLIIGIARMYHTSQHSPDENIAARNNFGPGIDIAQNHNRPQNTPRAMADRWDAMQTPGAWARLPEQLELVA